MAQKPTDLPMVAGFFLADWNPLPAAPIGQRAANDRLDPAAGQLSERLQRSRGRLELALRVVMPPLCQPALEDVPGRLGRRMRGVPHGEIGATDSFVVALDHR